MVKRLLKVVTVGLLTAGMLVNGAVIAWSSGFRHVSGGGYGYQAYHNGTDYYPRSYHDESYHSAYLLRDFHPGSHYRTLHPNFQLRRLHQGGRHLGARHGSYHRGYHR